MAGTAKEEKEARALRDEEDDEEDEDVIRGPLLDDDGEEDDGGARASGGGGGPGRRAADGEAPPCAAGEEGGGNGGDAAMEAGGPADRAERDAKARSVRFEGPTLYSARRIIKESAPLLLMCLVAMIFGGQMLNAKEAVLVAIPLLLMAIPVINGVGGNIGTVLGMRFTSALHLGTITPSLEGRTLRSNLVQGLALGVISFGILAVLTALTMLLPGFDPGIDPLRYMLIVFGSGLTLTVLLVLVTIISAVVAFKFGYDPDNVVTPIVTTTGDILGILCLLTFVTVLGVG